MSTIAGSVKTLSNGKFFVKDENGNIRELKVGDTIYENDTVYGEAGNSKSAKIEIALASNDIIVLSQGQKQLIDASLLESAYGEEELFFTTETALANIEAYRNMVDVVSDLRNAKWNDEASKAKDDEETTAGKEEAEDEDGSTAKFAARDGNMTDIESDLRAKKWIHTQNFREFENNRNLLDHGTKELGKTPINPFERPERPGNITPPPPRPSTDKPKEDPDRPKSETKDPESPTDKTPPPYEPPVNIEVPAELSINDVVIYESDGKLVFTVALDKPLRGDVTFSYKTSSGTAKEGEDYIGKSGTITIPKGQTSVTIEIDAKDDYLYEKSEYFNIDITNIIGNAKAVKPHGTGTILDNPPTTNTTVDTSGKPDSASGTYGPEDTVYVKLVNSATVKEGINGATDLDNSTLKHYIQLVDKDGESVEIPAGKSITVELEYKDILGMVTSGDFKDGGDFIKATVTLDSNSPKDSNGIYIIDIKNPAIYDSNTEGLEIYELSIKNITQNGDPFENVAKHPTEHTVTGAVYDTVPVDVKIETTEDNSKDLSISNNIKDMFVDNGKGFVKVPENGEVILYDNDEPIGTITYDKSNNKFTFKPYDDYSDYTKSGDVKFLYYAVNNDDSSEFKNVTVEVTPVADAPTVTVNDVTTYEDNQNTQEGQHKIALELKTPTLSKDQTDKNGAAGDHPERNGEITLKFTNGNSVSGAKLFKADGTELATITTANQLVKVVIVDDLGNIDYDYHHKDVTTGQAGTLYLTKTEYENLKIQHAEDNDTDIKINIGVTSYELDDDGKPLAGSADYSKSTNADMTVVILPVTDDISIKWDNNSLGAISNNDKTYTFTDVTKVQYVTLKLQDIMSATSGAQNGIGGTKGDLDGSEKRTYIIEGLPKDAVVTLGTTAKTVGADGKVIIDFPDNTKPDPNFSIKLPQYYQGTVNGTITLKVQDKGVEESSDSSKWGAEKTDSVNFKINVMPVVIDDPSNQTIQIAQAIGDEDAGRSKNNILNSGGVAVSSSANITNPENGLKLNIEPKGSNMAAKGETATIWIDKVPVGGSLYIYDNSTKAYKLIGVEGGKVYEYTKDGTEYTTKTELVGGKSGNITVTLNGDNTYKVEILDYQNPKKDTIEAPKFIPPHNDDSDYIFKISGEKVSSAVIDGQTLVSTKPYNGGNTLDMSVIVKNIADEPINTELVDSAEKTVTIGGTKYIKATEDKEFALKDIYKNGTPSSFDTDGSEVLSIKITLPSGVTMIDGAKYKVDGNEYVVKSTDLENIKLTFPKNFSGTVGDIKLKYITTEQSGENSSKTHFEQTVKLFVNPVAEAEISKSTTGDEDSIFKVDFNIVHKNSDNDETLESVWIKASDVTSKDFTLYIGNDGSKVAITTLTPNAEGYYELTSAQWNNIYAQNTAEHTHGNYKFDVKYSIKDTAGTVSDTKTSNFDYELNIKAVTDTPTLNVGVITTDNTSKVTINDKTVTIKEPSAEFKVPLTTTSDDKDGSETVQEIVISGVPQGVEVVGATYYGYNGSIHNGIWVIKNPSDKILNSDGASSEITFKVNPGSNFENRDIKITTYTKDSGDAKVESASQTIRIEKDSSYDAGNGTGTPPLFNLSTQSTTIYEDNDSDPKTDGNQDEYNLGKSILVANAGGGTIGNYAVTITDFPTGTTVTGYDYSYVEGGKTFYVVTGSGNAADVMEKLSNVVVTPPKDMNTGGDINGKMTFSATISTFDGGVFKEGTAINNHENDITPVTDPMTVTITANNINEDGTSTININLSNPSDGSKTNLGDTLTITVVENWKDTLSGGPVNGEFNVPTGYKILSTDTDSNGNKVYNIQKDPASNFSIGDINGLTYKAPANRDGDVTFEVSVQNTETGSSLTLDSKGEKTITVAPVIDTVLDASTVVATGTEDVAITGINLQNPLKVTITADGSNPLVITDKSETLGNIVLDKIPNGMTVWYKDTDGTLKMATNIGTSTGTYVLNPNGDNTAVSVNKWLIPTNGSNVVPEIYVNAPENWAGTFNFDVKLSIYEQNLATPVETPPINQTAEITAVADGFSSASAKKMTKNVFQWLDLQINANMKDTDGSEVMNVELTGLSKDAQFKLKDGSLTNPAVWNADTSKWTISGVKVDDINDIQFMDMKATTSVTADIWTKELGNNNESSKVSLSGNLAEIKAVTGTFTFDKELSLDFNNIDPIKTDETYNIGLKDITSINLGASNGAKNELLNLMLQDVLDMGKKDNDGNINLEILGGGTDANKDKVTFADNGNWAKSAEVNQNGYWEYTHKTDTSVKIQIKSEIDQPII